MHFALHEQVNSVERLTQQAPYTHHKRKYLYSVTPHQESLYEYFPLARMLLAENATMIHSQTLFVYYRPYKDSSHVQDMLPPYATYTLITYLPFSLHVHN